MIAAGVDEGASELGRWVEALTSQLGGLETEAEIAAAIDKAAERIDPTEFARIIEEQLVHGAMLGAVDSMLEREQVEDEPLPVLASWRSAILQRVGAEKKLSGMPFEQAVKLFEERQILPRAQFDQLRDAAKRKAFTVAGLAAEELLQEAHGELARQIRDSREKTYYDEATGKWVYKGPNLREFDKFARDRLEKAGWTPANPSHVETVFRTNTMSAYGSGRIVETTQPAVLATRPYWQIVAVGDSRSRPAHRKAHGTILSADNPFWRRAYPPFGYNCRCRVISRSKRWVDAHGGPTRVPDGLPDKGFASGIDASLVPSLDVATEGKRAPTPASPAHPIDVIEPIPIAPPIQKAPTPGTAFTPDGTLAPIAPPKPTVKPGPSTVAADIMSQQIAGPGGSNAGGVFVGKDGVKRYVKLYDDPSQAAGEHLANKLYADLGVGKVKSQLFELNGKTAYASQYIEGATPIGKMTLTPELAKEALDGLVGDLVTANWDAVGLTLDNLVSANGQILRIDNGGTFLMRAQAGRKPAHLLNELTEWDGFFDPAANPTYAKLAQIAGVSRAVDMLPAIKKQLGRLLRIADEAGGWAKYVAKHAPTLAESDASAISSMLEARANLIAKKIVESEKALAKKAKSTAKRKLEELPAEPLPIRLVVPGVEKKVWEPGEFNDRVSRYKEATRVRAARVMTDEERQAIGRFTNDSEDIRAAARMTREEYEQARATHPLWMPHDQAKATGDRINQAIEKARTAAVERPEQLVTELYRGIRGLSKATFDDIINRAEYEWMEPSSASWMPSSAKNFYENDSENTYSVFFRIKPAQNSAGAAIEGISEIPSEHEVLFKGGSKFKVVNVTRDADFERGAIVYIEEL